MPFQDFALISVFSGWSLLYITRYDFGSFEINSVDHEIDPDGQEELKDYRNPENKVMERLPFVLEVRDRLGLVEKGKNGSLVPSRPSGYEMVDQVNYLGWESMSEKCSFRKIVHPIFFKRLYNTIFYVCMKMTIQDTEHRQLYWRPLSLQTLPLILEWFSNILSPNSTFVSLSRSVCLSYYRWDASISQFHKIGISTCETIYHIFYTYEEIDAAMTTLKISQHSNNCVFELRHWYL